ncbi:DUF402 domain-containing protein [Streptomyces cinerochromogenes]|uniref:DUF402 domain-containing protein n=1 Tax=Streptomyces cinerochromogenes TaxID=66422 RepID=UPI00166FD72C|nr:DUF402 domain-containing protein [Streptomyces cinerochromogenes]GGS71424.1 hypothetical protein GCM10010206_37200 [Streptomyces cinerochromogenes]
MSVNSAEPGARLEVVLVKAGRTKIRYPAELLQDDGNRITVRAPWAGSGVRDFGFVRFEPGDVFTEYYWRDRWYSVKEVRAADGSVKGWYCDVTRPAVLLPPGTRPDGETAVGPGLVVEDLDLDLWRSADGRDVRRLDEDEFAGSGLTETDPQAASAAVAALDTLEALASRADGFEELLS